MSQHAQGPADGAPTCYRHPDRETYIRCQRCDRPICPDCMRDAAVGFQCPDCVAEGARSTRSGRTAYGGTRSSDPTRTSMALIGINVAVWVAVLATGGAASGLLSRLMLTLQGRCYVDDWSAWFRQSSEAVCPVQGGRWVDGALDGSYWQVLSSGFAHVELWHIGFNMLALWFLGPQLEAAMGRLRFLALYFVSLLTASAAVVWLSSPGTSTLGASGAIWGLLGALLVLTWKVGGDIRTLGGWLAANLVFTFLIPNISWQGHLGGLAGGALVALILAYAPKGERRPLAQWSGIGLLTVVTLALVVVRAVLG